jgi:hypothetical protein
MIAKGYSLRNQGDIASTGRNHGLEGQDITPCRNSSQDGEAALHPELDVSSGT